MKQSPTSPAVHRCREVYLGSITHVANANSSLKQESSYDAWGRLRNPATQVVYTPGSEPTLFLGRGYTGHEHLPWFGLINMNARLYDAALGRFLSPDPYVQMPNFTQNFNRYSYCLNNPLIYVDENGEFIIGYFSGFIRGLVQGKNPFKTGWQTGVNELKIYAGLFTSDSNKGFFGGLWELVSRFTWQLPQTIAGVGYTALSNWTWQVDKVDYWGGATVSSGNNWGKSGGAVTLGSYIIGGRSLEADPHNFLFQHEYGHYLQSQSMGWAYLSRVGIPSLISMSAKDGNHDFRIFEQDANRRAFNYFNEKVGDFYQTEDEYLSNRNAGIQKGWNFYQNPLDIYHVGEASRLRYVDYKNPVEMELVNKLVLRAKWYDYAAWIFGLRGVLAAGYHNGASFSTGALYKK